jgi:hypothetical protein
LIATAKALMFALAIAGIAAGEGLTGAGDDVPLEQAKQIHHELMGDDSRLPDQATKGQQTAMDHIVLDQERWLAKHDLTGRGI